MVDSGPSGRWNVFRHVRRESRDEHAPNLWPVWAEAPVVLALGAAAAYLVFRWLHTAAVPIEVPGGRPRVDSLAVLQTTLTVLAFVGALLAGLYAYRKQRLAEGDAARAQVSDRYTKAADQLGSDKAAIRLAGVYAMARLGDDWKAQRQTCIDVLCAYLRMPYQAPGKPDHRPGEEQVRKTIVRVIAAHLQPAASLSWSTANLDFTGAHLEDASFNGATFAAGARFDGATFTGGATFEGATFTGDTGFVGARFAGRTSFDGATFTGEAGFVAATFTGDTRFVGVTFTGDAEFDGATFFAGARFDGATFTGDAAFDGVTFSGDAEFVGAALSGGARFTTAMFSRVARFDGATFSGTAGFNEATFTRDA